MEQPTREGLIRAIRRWDLVALVINAIVGAGIFGLPSEVFSRTGVYSLLAFVVCAVAVMLIVLCFAEVSSRFSDTGGPYLYAREAFGPLVGFEVGWMMWIARVTAFAANCNLLVAYLAYFAPWAGAGTGRVLTITVIVLALTLVNLAGVRDAAIVSNVFTVAKLVPLTLFIVVGCFFIDPAAYALGPAPAFGDFSVSVLLLVYTFGAFEMVVIAGGESRNPRRDLPYALLVAIAVVTTFYVMIQVVAIGTLPGLADASRPLTDAASRFLGPLGAAIIAVGALVSILGNLNATLLVAPRLPFAMAQRHELPGLCGGDASAVPHATRGHSWNRRRGAGAGAFRHLRLCRDDQCDCQAHQLRGDLRGAAGAAPPGRRARRALRRPGGRCSVSNCPGVGRVASVEQHRGAGTGCRHRRRHRVAGVLGLESRPRAASSPRNQSALLTSAQLTTFHHAVM